MKRTRSKIFVGMAVMGLALVLSAPRAHAIGIGAVGGASYAMLTGTSAAGGALGFGGGLIVSLPFIPLIGMELSPTYMMRNSTGTNVTALEVPLFIRLNFVPIFGLALGGYFAYHLSAPATIQNYDFGLAGSLRLRVGLGPVAGLIADARFLMGLGNVGVSGTTNYMEPQFLVGFMIGK